MRVTLIGAVLVSAAVLPGCGTPNASKQLTRFHACVRRHHFGVASAKSTWLRAYQLPRGIRHWEMVTKIWQPLPHSGLLPKERANVAAVSLATSPAAAGDYARRTGRHFGVPGTGLTPDEVAGSAGSLAWFFIYDDPSSNRVIAKCARDAAK